MGIDERMRELEMRQSHNRG
ncbi:uncharacterized protein G2W53_010986 [Senna tora]|uniref:Uncharacterized protein n=1 Tax=Senna tora TaxID=362788 RepID=A0A834X223_9FABA|nr:uncharacterized protein G2W53_010986 [Senna tora]